jgi:hypothetical protein
MKVVVVVVVVRRVFGRIGHGYPMAMGVKWGELRALRQTASASAE